MKVLKSAIFVLSFVHLANSSSSGENEVCDGDSCQRSVKKCRHFLKSRDLASNKKSIFFGEAKGTVNNQNTENATKLRNHLCFKDVWAINCWGMPCCNISEMLSESMPTSIRNVKTTC